MVVGHIENCLITENFIIIILLKETDLLKINIFINQFYK